MQAFAGSMSPAGHLLFPSHDTFPMSSEARLSVSETGSSSKLQLPAKVQFGFGSHFGINVIIPLRNYESGCKKKGCLFLLLTFYCHFIYFHVQSYILVDYSSVRCEEFSLLIYFTLCRFIVAFSFRTCFNLLLVHSCVSCTLKSVSSV